MKSIVQKKWGVLLSAIVFTPYTKPVDDFNIAALLLTGAATFTIYGFCVAQKKCSSQKSERESNKDSQIRILKNALERSNREEASLRNRLEVKKIKLQKANDDITRLTVAFNELKKELTQVQTKQEVQAEIPLTSIVPAPKMVPFGNQIFVVNGDGRVDSCPLVEKSEW